MTRILLGLLIASIFALPNPAWSQTGQPWNQISEKAQKAFDRGLKAIERERYKKALTEFTLACDEGAAGGCINAINIAGNDDYGLRNEALVIRMARQACDLDDVDGCIAAGASYKYGLNGVEVNKVEAERYLGKACDDGFGEPDACVEAAPFILRDSQRLDELEGFFDTIENACEEDDANPSRSCLMLAGFMRHGVGSTRDREGAKEIYTEYCDQDIGHACHQLGILEHQRYATSQQAKAKRKAKAAEFLDQACQLEEVAACVALVELEVGPENRYGSSNWMFDDFARRRIERAVNFGCEQEHPHACFSKGVLLHLGELGPPDIAEAYRLIELSCNMKHYQACVILLNYKELGPDSMKDLSGAADLRSNICFGLENEEDCSRYISVGSDVTKDPRFFSVFSQNDENIFWNVCKSGRVLACFRSIDSNLPEAEQKKLIRELLDNAVTYCAELTDPSNFCSLAGLLAQSPEFGSETYAQLIKASETYSAALDGNCRDGNYFACISLILHEDLRGGFAPRERVEEVDTLTRSALKAACDQEDLVACSLGLADSAVGSVPFERRSEAGREYYYKALQSSCYGGVITACVEYANIVYSNGNFAPVDKVYALELFESNCRSGLGDCLR